MRPLEPKLVEKQVEEVSTKVKEAKDAELEVDMWEDTATMELLLNTRDCVVI